MIRERRVKCDEGKPECNRCSRINVCCPGYDVLDQRKAHPRNFNDVKVHRKALRANKSSPSHNDTIQESAVTSPVNRLGSPLRIKSGPNLSQLYSDHLSHDLHLSNEIEQRYFQIFREKTGPELSVWNSLTWNRLILQASHNQPFVSHGVVALSALVQAHKLCPIGTPTLDLDAPIIRTHYEFALKQYSKSIRLMRLALLNKDIRNTLLSSLLIFSIESLMGHQDIAIQHAQSGVKILQEWLACKACSHMTAAGIASPAPESVEDDLVQAFGFLDVQIMNLVDIRPRSVHLAMMKQGDEVMETMPIRFRDLTEARQYLELLMRRVGHFLRATAGSSPSYSAATMKSMGRIQDADMSASTQTTLADPFSQHMQYRDELARWHNAADPLLEYPLSTPDSPAQIRSPALYMAIYTHTIHWCLDTVFSSQESVFDKYKAQFRETIALVYQLTEIMGSAKSSQNERHERSITCDPEFCFSVGDQEERSNPPEKPKQNSASDIILSFDICVTTSLYLICKRCRSPSLRRAALYILRTFPHRDGSWDAGHTAAVLEAVMLLEEASAVALMRDEPLPTQIPLVPVRIPIVFGDSIRISRHDDTTQVGVQEWLKQSEGPELYIPTEARVHIRWIKINEEAKMVELECERGTGKELLRLQVSRALNK